VGRPPADAQRGNDPFNLLKHLLRLFVLEVQVCADVLDDPAVLSETLRILPVLGEYVATVLRYHVHHLLISLQELLDQHGLILHSEHIFGSKKAVDGAFGVSFGEAVSHTLSAG